MKLLLTLLLFTSAAAPAQDTIRLRATRQQVTQALVEKGYAIAVKEDNRIVTKALERNSLLPENKNQILTRLCFVFDGDTCKLTGDYTRRFSYIHQGDKSWMPISNSKRYGLTWPIVSDFAKYLSGDGAADNHPLK